MVLRRAYLDDGAGGQIHIARSGPERSPDALLLHQTPRSWDEFREVMAALDGRHALVAMDLPGMGASSPAETPSIQAYAAAAAGVLSEIADAPAVVCGHHTGGVVAIELAARRPDLVRSLVLSSTPWIDAEARAMRADKAAVDVAPVVADGTHLASLWDQRRPFYPPDPAYLQRFMADALAAADPAEGHLAVGAYRMEAAAPRVTCPVLIVEHAADPFAAAHLANLRRAFPQAELATIRDGGVALEATAGEFATILDGLLSREER